MPRVVDLSPGTFFAVLSTLVYLVLALRLRSQPADAALAPAAEQAV